MPNPLSNSEYPRQAHIPALQYNLISQLHLQQLASSPAPGPRMDTAQNWHNVCPCQRIFLAGTFVTALVASTMFLVLVDFDPCACLPNDPVKNAHCLVITHTYVELTNSQFKWRTPQR